MTITKREAALRELQKLQRRGVYESGRNNDGPMVDKITRADSLPGEDYSWCQSTQNYTWELANGESLAGGTASVYFFRAAGQKHGWLVTRPKRADHVTFRFHSAIPIDHVGQIERVLRFGPVCYLVTIEGNTGPAGAVSDPGTGRDGIYRKRRVVKRGSVSFIRVPGLCPHPERYLTPRDRWLKWVLSGRKGKRPHVPWRIPRPWWNALKVALAKRRRPK